MRSDPGVSYFVERDGQRWALFCAPGDEGYPSRHVATFDLLSAANQSAYVLSYIARMDGADAARECEPHATLERVDA